MTNLAVLFLLFMVALPFIVWWWASTQWKKIAKEYDELYEELNKRHGKK